MTSAMEELSACPVCGCRVSDKEQSCRRCGCHTLLLKKIRDTALLLKSEGKELQSTALYREEVVS